MEAEILHFGQVPRWCPDAAGIKTIDWVARLEQSGGMKPSLPAPISLLWPPAPKQIRYNNVSNVIYHRKRKESCPPHSLLLTCPTRVINLLHLVNLHWSIIAQDPWFTLAFTLGVVCSLCFDKCIMIYMCVCVCVCVYTHTIVISYRTVLHTEHVVLCCAELSHSVVSDSLRPHGL